MAHEAGTRSSWATYFHRGRREDRRAQEEASDAQDPKILRLKADGMGGRDIAASSGGAGRPSMSSWPGPRLSAWLGSFSATHERFWAAARAKLGDGAGTRALIGVVLLQRRMASVVVVAAMEAALGIGSVDPEVVAIEARRLAQARPPAPVVPIGTGSRDTRPPPRLDHYDELLAAGGEA